MKEKNLFVKALNLLLQQEKDGFEPMAAPYSVIGEIPPFKIHVSLYDMYSRAGVKKKAPQALGVLEAKKEELGLQDFEGIVNCLIAGGFMQEAKRLYGMMEAQGISALDQQKVALMASQTFTRKRPMRRYVFFAAIEHQ
ncbi:hypothetical protein SLEP1_g59406 [Rubroshorea leprosula]|uniref:Pentatricopeptide repeat-containing protein n=1 Tax=Rubroshorea leprosula TaxID=152421 RepID=A0AAV5MS94_9ROSI|nr:hypothetical protein SLEP1_g59406 [Rubroshorea leprosula]